MALGFPDWLRFEIRAKWEQLPVRRWINNNPRVVISITGFSVFVLLLVVITQLTPEKTVRIERIEKEWFYDLNTGKSFAAKKGLTPPIKAPSGRLADGQPAGVRAYVLTYAYEPNESELFIAFLETTDFNSRSDSPLTANSRVSGAEEWGKGKLVRRPEDERWVPADSVEGLAILEEAFAPNENGERPYYYPPK